jgi:hypothetical protein
MAALLTFLIPYRNRNESASMIGNRSLSSSTTGYGNGCKTAARSGSAHFSTRNGSGCGRNRNGNGCTIHASYRLQLDPILRLSTQWHLPGFPVGHSALLHSDLPGNPGLSMLG